MLIGICLVLRLFLLLLYADIIQILLKNRDILRKADDFLRIIVCRIRYGELSAMDVKISLSSHRDQCKLSIVSRVFRNIVQQATQYQFSETVLCACTVIRSCIIVGEFFRIRYRAHKIQSHIDRLVINHDDIQFVFLFACHARSCG